MNSTVLHLKHPGIRLRCVTLFLITVLLSVPEIFSAPAPAAVTEGWVHRYNNVISNLAADAVKVVIDSAGDVIVIGNIPESGFIAIIKYSDADGSVAWQKLYHSAGSLTSNQAKDVGVDGCNNVFVLARSYPQFSNEQPTGYFVLKLAASDGALLWEKPPTGTGQSDEFGYALAVDGAGNVVVTALIPEIEGNLTPCTAKYAAADGALLWEQCDSGRSGSPFSTRRIALDGNGNVIVAGAGISGPPSYNSDYYTTKYAAADGALLWEQRYNGAADQDDYIQALAVDSDGNVVVTGGSGTIRYLANGTSVWTNTVLESTGLAVDGSGNVVVTGRFYDGVSSDYRTIKFAADDGTLLWEQIHNGENVVGEIAGVAVDRSGNVVVTGESGSDYAGNSAYHTAKFAALDGALLWEQFYDRSEGFYGRAVAIAVDASGNVVVTGNSAISDICTVKHSAADGALLWDNCFDGSAVATIFVRALTVDTSGNVIVTATAQNGLWSHQRHTYTAKYAADGALVWEKRYADLAYDEPTPVVVDASGNVIVTGSILASGNRFRDFYTAKLAAGDGSLLWEKRYNGPANNLDFANSVAVDSSGNVVVTGRSSSGTNSEIYTAKYAAVDGALLWEQRYVGISNGMNYGSVGYAVAVDGDDNVVVTGDSGNGVNQDYYTAKYAATDGALLWERRYNGPGDQYDHVHALAVDGDGNVVVTGLSATIKYLADGTRAWTNAGIWRGDLAVDGSGNVVVVGSCYNTNGNSDFYTVKYAATDGELLWERRYDPADGDDFASAVAVDKIGNVVVTGGSWNGTSTDYYTAKYAAADGTLFWEKRYNGPANGEDSTAYAYSLALGPSGMVAITGRSANLDGIFAITTVVYRENLPAVSIALVPAGVRLRFTGTLDQSYQIERAPTVTGPWTTIATMTAPASGVIEYVDSPALSGSAFYRTQVP